MRSILGRCFVISENLFCLSGLGLVEGRLEPQIGFISNGENVIFNPEEWEKFWERKNEIESYFESKEFESSSAIEINKEILYRTIGPKEILIKCRLTWNACRMNASMFEKLMKLNVCIKSHVKNLKKRVDWANYRMKDVVEKTFEKLCHNFNVSQQLFQACLDIDLIVPKPPKISDLEIIYELRENEKNGDTMTSELVRVFEDFLIFQIRKKMSAEERINIPKNLNQISDGYVTSRETGVNFS